MTVNNCISTLADYEPFKSLDRWVLWRLTPARREGSKPRKMPVHADGHTPHSTINPAPTMSAALAAQWLAYCHATGVGHDRVGEVGYIGLGIRLHPDDRLACFDIDDCIVDGQWSARAVSVMQALPGALCELSVSGRGLHVWTKFSGEWPGVTPISTDGAVEAYANARFIALGRVLGGDATIDRTAEMHALLASDWPAPVPCSEAQGADWEDIPTGDRAEIIATIRQAMPHIDQSDYDGWMRAGCALKSMGDDGIELWHEFSAMRPEYDEYECDKKWRQLRSDRTNFRAIFAQAQRGGWENPNSRESRINHTIDTWPDSLSTAAVQAVIAPIAPTAVPGTAIASAGAQAQTLDMSGSSGMIQASMLNVSKALLQNMPGLNQVAYDEFRASVMTSDKETWRTWVDTDYTSVRIALEQSGFKPVPAEVARSAVQWVANSQRFDSAMQWANGLVWDGVPRIAQVMSKYYRCEDTEYARAVGLYLFTALAGRCLSPGCQADMVPVLVSDQGRFKTSSVAALAPTQDAFVEVNLAHRDDNLSRTLRGKLVAELAELRGLASRDMEGIRAWITRRHERWVPKYQEAEVVFPRRFVAIGTANGTELLDDADGERRWLPIRTAGVDLPALVRDRDQLWAEGVALWRVAGVQWQDAQRLGEHEVADYKVIDPWSSAIEAWLEAPPSALMGFKPGLERVGDGCFTSTEVMRFGLMMPLERLSQGESRRVSRILKGLGYDTKVVRDGRSLTKKWYRV